MNINFNFINEFFWILDVFKEEILWIILKFKDNKIYESIFRMWFVILLNLYLIVFMKEIVWDWKWF